MIIIVDSREQNPFTFDNQDCEVTAGSLTTGDYSLAGLMVNRATVRQWKTAGAPIAMIGPTAVVENISSEKPKTVTRITSQS